MKTSKILKLCLIGLAGVTGGISFYRSCLRKPSHIRQEEEDEASESKSRPVSYTRPHGYSYPALIRPTRGVERGGFGYFGRHYSGRS